MSCSAGSGSGSRSGFGLGWSLGCGFKLVACVLGYSGFGFGLVWFLLGRGTYIGPVLWIWNWYVVVVIDV